MLQPQPTNRQWLVRSRSAAINIQVQEQLLPGKENHLCILMISQLLTMAVERTSTLDCVDGFQKFLEAVVGD